MSDLNSFFSGGGGRSVSWKDKPLGSKVEGAIIAVHEPQQQTDPATGEKQFKKNGDPKMSVRIDLQTDYRNWEMCKQPTDDAGNPDTDAVDDGQRALYVQGWMQGAVGDALRKAGRQGPPQANGWLSVTLSERQRNDNPALNAINKFTAEYRNPSAQATGEFFSNSGQTSSPGTVSNGLSAPAAAVSDPLPAKPADLAQSAWDAMPDSVKRSVAASMASISSGNQDDRPPF